MLAKRKFYMAKVHGKLGNAPTRLITRSLEIGDALSYPRYAATERPAMPLRVGPFASTSIAMHLRVGPYSRTYHHCYANTQGPI
eukprot:3177848-Rhodomonas_salina.4